MCAFCVSVASALESGEGVIVYSIYLRLRRPTGHWALLRADPLDRAPRWIETCNAPQWPLNPLRAAVAKWLLGLYPEVV